MYLIESSLCEQTKILFENSEHSSHDFSSFLFHNIINSMNNLLGINLFLRFNFPRTEISNVHNSLLIKVQFVRYDEIITIFFPCSFLD